MNINGFPIGRQMFCPGQPIECFVSKRHFSNVTDRKGGVPRRLFFAVQQRIAIT